MPNLQSENKGRPIPICRIEAGFSDPAFFVAKGKIEVKHTEVILILTSQWRKPYKVLILRGKLLSSNLEKVEKNPEPKRFWGLGMRVLMGLFEKAEYSNVFVHRTYSGKSKTGYPGWDNPFWYAGRDSNPRPTDS